MVLTIAPLGSPAGAGVDGSGDAGKRARGHDARR